MERVRELRANGISCWFSIDTGSSVYVNTYPAEVEKVADGLKEVYGGEIIEGSVGDGAKILEAKSDSG